MKPEGSLGGHLTYSQNLIDSGVRGLRSGKSILSERSVPM